MSELPARLTPERIAQLSADADNYIASGRAKNLMFDAEIAAALLVEIAMWKEAWLGAETVLHETRTKLAQAEAALQPFAEAGRSERLDGRDGKESAALALWQYELPRIHHLRTAASTLAAIRETTP